MAQILTDLSASALAAANKANLYSFFRRFEQSPTGEFEHVDGLLRWHTPHPYFWFNSVLCSRDATSADGALIDQTLTYFKSRKIASIGWWLEDGVSRESWEELLEPRGFQFRNGPPGMGVDLSKLPDSVPAPRGLHIRKIEDTNSLHPYAHLLTRIFDFPADTKTATYNWLLGIGLEMPCLSYMAYLDGEPVGTSAMYFGAGVAGIYSVGVLPEVRGLGIGTALTLHPLLEARELGYCAGILQSSNLGFHVYKRLGFEHHCNLGCFYYSFSESSE